MSEDNTIVVLCIGGKHDGRRVRVDRYYSQSIRLYDLPSLPSSVVPFTEIDQAIQTTVQFSTYIIEKFNSENRTFYLGRPPEQSRDSTFALLIQGYRGV